MKKLKILICRILTAVVLICTFPGCCNRSTLSAVEETSTSYPLKARDGMVPDETTAIKIAEAIWLPIYGDIIYKSAPFVAELKDSVWIVKGTLPEGREGGTPYIEIKKKNGETMNVTHTK